MATRRSTTPTRASRVSTARRSAPPTPTSSAAFTCTPTRSASSFGPLVRRRSSVAVMVFARTSRRLTPIIGRRVAAPLGHRWVFQNVWFPYYVCLESKGSGEGGGGDAVIAAVDPCATAAGMDPALIHDCHDNATLAWQLQEAAAAATPANHTCVGSRFSRLALSSMFHPAFPRRHPPAGGLGAGEGGVTKQAQNRPLAKHVGAPFPPVRRMGDAP